MRASTRPEPCTCSTCAPPAASTLGDVETWLLIVGFVLIPGRALLHIIWGALH
jgi:hypothetical protein